jgi:pyruvate/2-oxoglutarate/acetoin dehydrogenase E1 component
VLEKPCDTLNCPVLPSCAAAAENGFMGMGIGAAMTGLRPIVEGMNMGFLLLAFNQVRQAHTNS